MWGFDVVQLVVLHVLICDLILASGRVFAIRRAKKIYLYFLLGKLDKCLIGYGPVSFIL